MTLLEIYNEERQIEYRGELYSVRDNGSIMRHPKEGTKARKNDNVWTFGNYSKKRGYFCISDAAVHRIVACAFLADNDKNSNLVVDHIDTNKLNNRPTNLRWVTRFENLVLNEITRTKVELLCGMPIEEILKDMSILRDKKLPPNFDWMKTVSQEEADKTLERWKKWVAEKRVLIEKGEFTERVIKKYYSSGYNNTGEYPLEPRGINLDLIEYYNVLKNGLVLYKKTYGQDTVEFKIFDYVYNKEESYIAVATNCEGGIKNYYITYIRRINDKYEYETRSFFSPDGVDKYMTLAKGEEWSGGEVIDDYC